LLSKAGQDAIRNVHKAYFDAGADIAITATYQTTSKVLKGNEEDGEDLAKLSVKLARQAAGKRDVVVACSVGPYGAVLHDGSEYTGAYGKKKDSFEFLRKFHRDRLDVLEASNADVLAIETIPCMAEVRALVDVLKKPAWISLSCKDSNVLNSGESVEDAIRSCHECKSVLAIGFNCCAPRYALPLLRKAKKLTNKPLIIYPNSGESWDGDKHCWTGCGELKEQDIKQWISEIDDGLILGGCCRVGPSHIRMIRNVVRGG
jgi:homocysteine S-methyltransferase